MEGIERTLDRNCCIRIFIGLFCQFNKHKRVQRDISKCRHKMHIYLRFSCDSGYLVGKPYRLLWTVYSLCIDSILNFSCPCFVLPCCLALADGQWSMMCRFFLSSLCVAFDVKHLRFFLAPRTMHTIWRWQFIILFFFFICVTRHCH